jgi:hypothetical protein
VAPGGSRVPAAVVLEADVCVVVPDGDENVTLVGRALDLRQPVAVRGEPDAAIVGPPVTDGSTGLPPDGVDAFGPEPTG